MPTILFHTTEDRLGDALIKLPAIIALKRQRPDIRLIWTTADKPSAFKRGLAPIVAGLIDEIHEMSGLGVHWWHVVCSPCQRAFDCIIASERRLRATLALKRVPHKTFVAALRDFMFSDRRPAGPFSDLPVYRQTQILFELAIEQPLMLPRALELPARYAERAAGLLPAGPVYVGFAPGAGGRDKCWPLACFIEAARAQVACGRTPVFFLGPDERDWRADIAEAAPGAMFPEDDARGTPIDGPPLAIALAARLQTSVANDSGAGHLLAAGGRPLVSLFGHTDARKFEPPYGARRVLRARDFGGTRVADIPVSAVLEAVQDVCRD